MTRVIFMNSPIRQADRPKHIPYGLAILAALADEAGIDVGILDVNAFRLNREQVRRDLKAEAEDSPIDMVGLSGLVTTYAWQKDIIPWIRKDLPDTLIVAGGGCASSIPRKMLKWNPELDMVCIGEGERTFMEILDHLKNRNFSDVKGIMYREDGEIIENPLRPLMKQKELNQLPYPAWNLLPMEEIYFRNSPLALSPEALVCRRRIDIISERGCPMQCTFCTHNFMGGDLLPNGRRLKPFVRWQSAEYVVEMIKYARLKMAIDFVSFLDENFLANKKRAYKICDLLEQEDLIGVVQWGCLGHANMADPELLTRLKRCGCTYVSYGFESADQRMLDSINKKQTPDRMQKALRTTIKTGLNPITTFMIGYEEEDLQSIYNTVKFWVQNGIQCIPFFMTPYPGTKIFKDNREKILEQYDGDYEKFVQVLGDATQYVVNLTKFSDPELLGLRDLMVMHDLKRIRKYAKARGVEIEDEDPEPIPGELEPTIYKESPMGELEKKK